MANLRAHRVQPRDNLATISQKYYGTPDYAEVIYQHNTDKLTSPNAIYWGQELVIPHIDTRHGSHNGS